MLSVHNWYFSTVSFFFLVHRSQMAHPLYQDPEPSEAKRRRKRLAQQAVQGKCPTYLNFSFTAAAHVTFSGRVYKLIVSLFGRLFNAFSCSLYVGCYRSRCPTLHCQIWFTPHQRLNWGEVKLPLFLDFAATSSSIGVFTLICATLCTYHFPFISMLMGVSSHHRLWLSHTFLGHIFLEG